MLKRLTLAAVLTTFCLSSLPGFAGGEGWTHDYEAAKKQAAEQDQADSGTIQ